MAYVALVSLAQTIGLSLNYHRHPISPQLKNQIISIHDYVIFLKEFLEEFPDKANSSEATRIREVAQVAEDIIEFSLSEQIQKSKAGRSKSRFRHKSKAKYERKLKNLTQELAEKVMEIKNNITVKDAQLGDSTAACSSSRLAPVHKDAVVGFDNDLMEIMSQLSGESSKLQVIPIVGTGGIGKTTLAKNIYDDPLILEQFELRAWVTVSQDHRIREIVSSLLVSIQGSDAIHESMKERKVHQNLKARRYLIVLDDVWSIEAWDDLEMMFPDDRNGSRIMLTTRLSDVASYAGRSSFPVRELRRMDTDQSWNLLRQKVFKQDLCPIELEYVGKIIARSCSGLPLAIVVISGLLSTVDQTEAAWRNIAEGVNSEISENDEQLDQILFLSYILLPHHLRPCFLYMACLPEDYEIRTSKLTRLWVAEGFLKPSGHNKSLEETAEEFLEELVRRSLVSVTKRKSNGRIKSFSIHDRIREMCIRKALEENFHRVPKFLREGIKIPHRASLFQSDSRLPADFYGPTIHTIIHLEAGAQEAPCCFGYFRLLRVLDLSYTFYFYKYVKAYPSLPAEIFELFHLRYLALNHPFEIPAAISNLQNLQTLIIGPRQYITHSLISIPLPPAILRMPQLRHLVLFLRVLPFKKGATCTLENLQTISAARNFACSANVLKMIPNLKKLGISYMAWRDYEEDYQLHNLIYMQQLENLKVKIYDYFPFPERVKPAFPGTLRKLTLSGVGILPWKDMNILGSLPNLEVLKLRNFACVGNKWETAEGEFPQLRFLLIDKSFLRHWITETSHFPRLNCLMICRCWYLGQIPDGIGKIAALELIEVDDWNVSLLESAKQIQDDRQSSINYTLQVRYIKAHEIMFMDDDEC